MKRCPECRRDYTDETLNFCLDDGAQLVDGPGEGARTAVLAGGTSTSESPTKSLVQKDSDPELSPVAVSAAVSRTRSWRLPVLVICLIFAAGFFFYRFYPVNDRTSPIDSIAVLPFQNRNTDADTQYLSEGLAESLIYRLSQLPDLKVSPTSTVFRYEGREVDPVAVGRELGVNAVLSGRIVQHGEKLTISVNLVDIRNDRLLWGEQYDRTMSELLSTQREIAREIVEKLRLKVSPDEKGLTKSYTESNQAYQMYLKGRFYWNKRTDESMHRSIDYYKQAIEADPAFALAYSGLADTYNLISAPEAGGGSESPNDVLPKAKAAATRALEIDPDLAEAHVSLAHSLYYYDRDFASAEREFKKAIELDPRYAVGHHWYAVF